ncbi:MAG: acyltransferase [Chitinophagales bacterium]|nr:acyltransferase [Chitinophagales bacterium]
MLSIFKINTHPERRYFGFDIVRAFSVILVMHMHFLQLTAGIIGLDYQKIPFPDPVDMFFVCSGFLIGYHHLKDIHKLDKITPKYTARFLVMRWVRTLPSYYLILTFLVLLTILVTKKFDIPVGNYVFTHNLFNYHVKFYSETWTISIEEWFYFTFPIIFYFITNFLKLNKKKSFISIVLLYIVVCNFLKIYYYYHVFPDHTFLQYAKFKEIVVLRMDTIAVGLLAAYVCFFYQDFWHNNRYKFLVIGLIIYLANMAYYWLTANKYVEGEFTIFYFFTFYYLLSPIGFMLFLPCLKTIKFKNNFVNHFILFTSNISYSMFLLHGTFFILVIILLRIIGFNAAKHIFISYVVWISMAYVLSYLFYIKFEVKVMNMRSKIITKLKLNE